MIEDIIEIVAMYLENLDREYDNDLVLLAEKILNNLNNTKSDMKALFSAIPGDVSEDIKDKLKTILK